MGNDIRDHQGGKAQPVSVIGATPDIATYKTQHMRITLHGTPGTVTKVDIPEWAWFIKMYAPSAVVFYSIDEDPVNGTAKTGQDLTFTDLSRGDILVPGLPEVRIPKRSAVEIRFSSATASADLYVGFSAGD